MSWYHWTSATKGAVSDFNSFENKMDDDYNNNDIVFKNRFQYKRIAEFKPQL